MTAAPIHLRDERFMLDPAGAAFWPARRILIAADLQFERPIPGAPRPPVPQGGKATLERLNRLLRLYRPAKVVILGGDFPGRGASTLLAKDERAHIEVMAREASFIWVSDKPDAAAGLPGVCVPLYREGAFTFRHAAGPQLGPRAFEVSGYFQPKASIDARAKRVSRPCFVTGGNRLMLPAFGAPSGGLDVHDHAISRFFPRGLRVFLLGQDQLFSFALEQLGRMAEVA
ncbi:phosphoesterase [Acidocella sp.]|uniref:phosphoesterase n=1 Tax=Acidocella sp. TaxID=50710 RepID=UPI0017E14F2D|nr:phosphoesterase [Acidocella sp.]NNM56962.1 phosphoesterase [Acidocella sp.]